jgi:hypothetical protein
VYKGYAQAFPRGVVAGFGVVAFVAWGWAVGSSGWLAEVLWGKQVCTGFSFSIFFGVIIGLIGGDPNAIGTRLGVSITASVSINSCTGGLNLGIAAGVAGAIAWADKSCIFGPVVAIFECGAGASIGLTVYCCNYNVLTSENSCR